jgi:hypothetical protein
MLGYILGCFFYLLSVNACKDRLLVRKISHLEANLKSCVIFESLRTVVLNLCETAAR